MKQDHLELLLKVFKTITMSNTLKNEKIFQNTIYNDQDVEIVVISFNF